MNNLRIAIIGLKGLPAFGGAATVGENIVLGLKEKYEFTVFSVSSHTSCKTQIEGFHQHIFKRFPVKKLNIFMYYLKSMIYCLVHKKYDLIHLHHSDGAFIVPLLKLRYPVVCTSHAQPQINEKWPKLVKFFFKINEKIMLHFATEITAVSNPLKEIYTKKTTKEIHFIPNGINLDQNIKSPEKTSEKYILFSAGRIIPLKGLHLFLDAMHILSYKGQITVIGDLDQMIDYKESILKKAEGLNVNFIDIIKDKSLLLGFVKNAELFIFPSLSENMSIMLLEAAFTRTPIVCSDIPANQAIFNHKEVLFFRSEDVADCSEKISFALNNSLIMREKSERAFTKLYNEFQWKNIVLLYEKVFHIAISKN